LLIKVKLKPHAKYERKGDDLYIEAVVDLYTMILGGESQIDTFGGKVKITIPKESQSGKTLKLKGLGMPKYENPATKGDLFVKLQVKLPVNLTNQQKELFEQLRKG
jgi:curved DNA-binding protein